MELLNERATLASRLRSLREEQEEPSADDFLAEEKTILDRIEAANAGPLDTDAVLAIFRELLGGCRALGGKLRVAMLGPWFSYSHLAAIERFGSSVDFIPVGNIAAVFEEVQQGQVDYGIVPIENSTDGRVIDTLDMFTQDVGPHLRRSAARHPPHAARDWQSRRDSRGSEQTAGPLAVPELAGEAPPGRYPPRK